MRTHTGLSRGSRNAHAKLTETDVAIIKRELMTGRKQQSLADQFRIGRPSISYIATGKTWKHVRADEERAT